MSSHAAPAQKMAHPAPSREAGGATVNGAPAGALLARQATALNGGVRVASLRALGSALSARPAATLVQRVEVQPNQTGLPDALKQGVESLSGMSLDDVRVHRNSGKPAQMAAHAYAQGSDIHLAPGQDHHLPHEAWHVVQQKQGRVKATMQLASGVAVNDDAGLEHEADVRGMAATRMTSPFVAVDTAAPQSSSGLASGVAQGHGLVVQRDRKKKAAKKKIKAERKRRQQEKLDGKTKRISLHPNDPLFKTICEEVMTNHNNAPYVRDALHETQPIMSFAMNASLSGIIPAVTSVVSPWTWWGTNPSATQGIEITRIVLLKNPKQRNATRQFQQKLIGSGKSDQLTTLYSGHGKFGTEKIVKDGHDPSYGQYHSLKGHGALGRGTYLSDQVNKAVTYSSGGQQPDEERSFLRYGVALGNTHETSNRGELRHRHHNELVRNESGKTVKQGTDAPPDEVGYWQNIDSIKGTKTSTPGSGLFGTWWNGKKFDSNEYLVRNPDQIIAQAQIFYKLTDTPPQPDGDDIL